MEYRAKPEKIDIISLLLVLPAEVRAVEVSVGEKGLTDVVVDTGSAAIYGLRGKKDVSVFILHPKGRVGCNLCLIVIELLEC